MVAAGTPAFERSAAAAYGRPAMIFLAVAGPTPGSASNSFSEAVFRSTGVAGAALALVSAAFVLPGPWAHAGIGVSVKSTIAIRRTTRLKDGRFICASAEMYSKRTRELTPRAAETPPQQYVGVAEPVSATGVTD